MFAPSGAMTREQVVTYATSDQVAPQQPHRSRIVLPLREGDTQLDALMVHELTHLLVCEIILPQAPGDGGVPRWVHEGIASYMADGWSDDDERLMRELVAAGNVPALSQLTGSGGFANPRLNDALGHVAFDYIESRWGPTSIRRFINALIVPRVDKTYDAVFDLTPAEFDAAFRQYAERRFRPVVRRGHPAFPQRGLAGHALRGKALRCRRHGSSPSLTAPALRCAGRASSPVLPVATVGHGYQHRRSTCCVISLLLGGFSPNPRACSDSWMTGWPTGRDPATETVRSRDRRGSLGCQAS